jgi:hypothetical protein
MLTEATAFNWLKKIVSWGCQHFIFPQK